MIKDQRKRPSTVLYEDRDRGPVMGWLVIMRGRRRGTDFRITQDTLVIGREGGCDVPLDDEMVSREHARIREEKGGFVLFDLGSSNGTFVNRERIQRHVLEDGDVIRLGESLLLFKQAKPGPKWTIRGADEPAPEDED